MEQIDAIIKVSTYLRGWEPRVIGEHEIEFALGKILVYIEKEFDENILQLPRNCAIWVVNENRAMVYSTHSTEYQTIRLR